MADLDFTFDDIQFATGGSWEQVPAIRPRLNHIVTDSRKDCTNALFIPLSGDNFDGHQFLPAAISAGASAIVVAKSFAEHSPLPPTIPTLIVEDPLAAYQDLARFHRHRLPSLRVVALTGSSGKTSTKEMLRAIFSEAFGADAVYATEGNTNNHVGVPMNILRLNSRHRIAVLEMGTNHPGEIKPLSRIAEPDAALITCIGNCHLEFFHDLLGVAREKVTVFSHMKSGGTAVIPSETPHANHLKEEAKQYEIVSFGTDDSSNLQCTYLGGNLYGSGFELKDNRTGKQAEVKWHLAGAHQAVNAAGAAAAAMALGVDLPTAARGLPNTQLPGMRMRITDRQGTTWINDAYNANPDSVKASLSWLGEFAGQSRLILVLGDMLELGDTALQQHIAVLNTASKLLPQARIFAVGPIMSEAGPLSESPTQITCYPDSLAAVAPVQNESGEADMVFLKASRGTRLEVIEMDDDH